MLSEKNSKRPLLTRLRTSWENDAIEKLNYRKTHRACLTLCCALLVMTLSGCVGMEIKEDGAKVFQANMTAIVVQCVISLVLFIVGYCFLHGFIRPYGRLKTHQVPKGERFSTVQLLSMLFVGLVSIFGACGLLASTFIVSKRNYTAVYPNRVEVMNAEAASDGSPIVIRYENLSSIQETEESRGFGRRSRTRRYLLFVLNHGETIAVSVDNNLGKARPEIENAIAEFRKNPNAVVTSMATTITPSTSSPSVASLTPEGPPDAAFLHDRIRGIRGRGNPTTTTSATGEPYPKVATGTQETGANASSTPNSNLKNPLKRYPIRSEIPTGYQVVAPNQQFKVGDKLKANYGTSWYYVTIVDFNSDGSIVCNWDDFPSFTYSMLRTDLISGGANEAKDSVASSNLQPRTTVSPVQPGGDYQLKRYPIRSSLPSGSSLVTPATQVRVGQKLQANYARQWENVTVEAINEDGTITCSWDNWPGFVYKMVREDLVVGQ